MANRVPVPARIRYLIVCAVGLLAAYTVGALLSYARVYIMHVLGEKIILQFRKDIYARLQTLSVSYFDNRQTGEIRSRVTSDTQVVEEFVNHAADTLICDPIRLVIMCVIMFHKSSTLALVALIQLPILFFVSYTFSRRIRSIYRAVRERQPRSAQGPGTDQRNQSNQAFVREKMSSRASALMQSPRDEHQGHKTWFSSSRADWLSDRLRLCGRSARYR